MQAVRTGKPYDGAAVRRVRYLEDRITPDNEWYCTSSDVEEASCLYDSANSTGPSARFSNRELNASIGLHRVAGKGEPLVFESGNSAPTTVRRCGMDVNSNR